MVQAQAEKIVVQPCSISPDSSTTTVPPMATKRSVLWSKEMFSPVDLKEKFTNHFPVIVMVARGYYGQTEIDTLGSDQVLILQGWSSQKRVVARDTRGRYISIPSDYPLKFEVTSKTDQDLYLRPVSSRARPLWQIIEAHRLPIQVQFDRQVSSCFYVGANPRCTETFGHLELIAVYDENYLKGNTINAGKIDTEAITVVPMYMKTHFVIAEGLKGTPANLWENMRQHYIARVRHLDFEHVNGNMDIMLYDNHVAAGSTEYDLLMPKSYVRHPSIGAISGRFSSEGTIKTAPKLEPRFYPLKTRSQSSSEQDQGQQHGQHQGQHQGQHGQHGQHSEGRPGPHSVIIHGEGTYTGLTHARPRTDSQTSSSPHGSYRKSNELSYYHPSCSSPPSREAPMAPKGGLTTENQGELVQALRTLSVTRQARLSDSSTDSSTTSSNSTTSNSEQSSSSPAKVPSPPCPNTTGHDNENNVSSSDDAACSGTGTRGNAVYAVLLPGEPSSSAASPPRRKVLQPRTHVHSETDSGKGSQYAVEELVSSDDSDDVFFNNEDPAVDANRRKFIGARGVPALQPLRRNRSESDAPRDVHWVYGGDNDTNNTKTTNGRCANSCSAMDNAAYCSLVVGGRHSRRPPGVLANTTFKSLEDIPEDISALTVEEISDCLRLLNLGMYVRKFSDYQVDGALLKAFTHEDIHKEFGISAVIAKKLEQFAKHGWRPRLNVSPCPPSPRKANPVRTA